MRLGSLFMKTLEGAEQASEDLYYCDETEELYLLILDY